MKKDVEYGKWCAVLMFVVPIVGIVWYLADDKMKKNSYAKFYFKQGLVFIIASYIGSFIAGILSFATFFTIIMPFLIMFSFYIMYFILWINGIINAFSGEEKKLIAIGDFAEKFTF